MKKALLALFAIATVTAASAFAADKTDVPAPVVDNGVRPPMERIVAPAAVPAAASAAQTGAVFSHGSNRYASGNH
ncbi:hypothetical protein KPZU09_05970 [Klebsiella pneumoniae]|uniref:Uncharacterized protein n=1 Tax=Klebsiella pneumoniae TaxID=573 RepID=A0A919LL45_KLEPN|nr:hypothetical protein KPZU09_05970 [Klebsiella pneumoniae]